MKIAATADVHAPNFFKDFASAMERLEGIDLFLIAGDMVERGSHVWYGKIHDLLSSRLSCPIVACFGNTEWIPDKRDEIRELCPGIRFVDDESIIVNVGKVSVGIIGTIGSLDRPTTWQERNLPDVMQVYKQRIELVKNHLGKLVVNFKIVLMHYAPTYDMLEGENPRFWANMGSRLYEDILMGGKPDLVVHAHSHKGRSMMWLDRIPVYNVSFALNRDVIVIDTGELKPGVSKFVRS
jgi:Icc-related predicted phosphoesterase